MASLYQRPSIGLDHKSCDNLFIENLVGTGVTASREDIPWTPSQQLGAAPGRSDGLLGYEGFEPEDNYETNLTQKEKLARMKAELQAMLQALPRYPSLV